jgi:hypothetical protein
VSGFSSQVAEEAACAKADVASPVTAAAIKKVVVENRLIVLLSGKK